MFSLTGFSHTTLLSLRRSRSCALKKDWISDSSKLIDKATYLEVLSQDVFNHAQQVVKAVRASNLHQEVFKATIRNGNTMKLWVSDDGEHVDIPQQLVLWDVKSCWDSIYTMVFCLWELQLVCNIFHVCRPSIMYFFNLPTQCDIANLKLAAIDWFILQDMELIFKV